MDFVLESVIIHLDKLYKTVVNKKKIAKFEALNDCENIIGEDFLVD